MMVLALLAEHWRLDQGPVSAHEMTIRVVAFLACAAAVLVAVIWAWTKR